MKLLQGAMFTTFIFGLALIAILLAGCAGPTLMTHEADKTFACMAMEWSDQERINEECGYGHTTGLPVRACVVGYRYIGPKPTDWGDEQSIFTVGHEFMHELGMEHP